MSPHHANVLPMPMSMCSTVMVVIHAPLLTYCLAQNSFYGGEGASFSISELEKQQKEENEEEAGGVGEADLDPCGSEEVGRTVREIVAGAPTFEKEGPSCVPPPPLRFVGLSETTQTHHHHHHHQIQQVLHDVTRCVCVCLFALALQMECAVVCHSPCRGTELSAPTMCMLHLRRD